MCSKTEVEARKAFCGLNDQLADEIKRRFAENTGCGYPPGRMSLDDYVKTNLTMEEKTNGTEQTLRGNH